MTSDSDLRSIHIPSESAGTRLDQFLVSWLAQEGLSRARFQALIDASLVLIDGHSTKASYRLKGGEFLSVSIPPPVPSSVEAQDLPLHILHEDAFLVVIDKAPGMAVHPARGTEDGTLVNALLYSLDELSGIGGEERPGIVHRLDKDTSGVLVVAKCDQAHAGLSEQFRVHSIIRRYRALVTGAPLPRAGTWESAIGRSPHNRLRMKSLASGGRRAVTHYKVLEVFPGASLLELTLETGRTHQIRVHSSEAGHPVLNDEIYGGHWKRGLPEDETLIQALEASGRQLLHARELGFIHPVTGDALHFISEPPEDFQRVLAVFRGMPSPEVRDGSAPSRPRGKKRW